MWAQLARGIARAAPARCEVCRAWPARPVCAACEARFAATRHRCRTCALAIPEGVDRCGRCLRRPPPLDACHAAVSYGYPWATLVGRFKFGDEAGWAGTFSDLLLRDTMLRDRIADARWVVAMPLSRERLAHRGFNQAHELARRLAPAKADASLVVRVRDTASQAELDHDSRQANVRRAFALEPARAASVHGQRVLLVDDVMTTGASLFALAHVFREAGASDVAAAVFARTEDT
ncbi:phosphoribosyltransferase family protein [Ramlibacter sp. MMS24-I3-19]|uniref:phosphoribosyltransferase family protein n=1 Tax=Ramlibacter sp. MMS24-I3-19 TaxID=3416606 RepID=UPI003D0947B9